MEYGISALWFALELIAFHLLWGAFLSIKTKTYQYLLGYLAAWILYIGLAILEFNITAERFVFIGVLCILCVANHDAPILQKILIACVSYIFVALVDMVILYGSSAVIRISLEDLVWRKIQYTTIVTIGKLLTVLMGWVFYHFRRKGKSENIENKWLLLTLLFPILSVILLIYVFNDFYDQADLSIEALLISAAVVVANIAIVYLIYSMERTTLESKKNAVLHMQMDIQTEGILALERSYRAQRKVIHEFQSQLQTIYDLLLVEDCHSAMNYVHQIREMQPTRTLAVNSHHPVLDAVLNHKYQIAQECDIQVDVKVNDLSNLEIESDYLVVLMSNLFDNAIEACMKLEKERYICCSVVQNDSVFISVRNTSLPVTIVGGTIPTTKEQKKDHGYGIPHIQHIVARLGGEYAFAYEDGWFEFVIEIPIVEK